MASSNIVVLVGHVGAEPESRSLSSGSRVTKFRMATNESWTDSGGNRKERTDWHAVEVWGRTADFVARYVHTGDLVSVVGVIRHDEWVDKEGRRRWSTTVKAHRLDRLLPKANGTASAGAGDSGPSGPPTLDPPGATVRSPAGGLEEALPF